MDIVKIIGVGLVSVIIIVLLKQYKPEYTIILTKKAVPAGSILPLLP